MWFNGDYILYYLAEQLSFDYLLLVEYDCVILGDVDRLIERLIAAGTDYAVKNFGTRRASYQWAAETMAWFGRTRRLETPYGGIFPAVFISREAIADLHEGRLEMTREIGHAPSRWVNCEPFCATHLHLRGYRCRALKSFLDVRYCTVDVPILPEVAEALDPRRARLVHPVLARPGYDRKLALLEDARARRASRETKRLSGQDLVEQALSRLA